MEHFDSNITLKIMWKITLIHQYVFYANIPGEGQWFYKKEAKKVSHTKPVGPPRWKPFGRSVYDTGFSSKVHPEVGIKDCTDQSPPMTV